MRRLGVVLGVVGLLAVCGLLSGAVAVPAAAQEGALQSVAQMCFEHHKFGAQPVDVAKTADGQTVLAQTSWNWHDAIGCYLTLDDTALAVLRAAPAPQSLPDAETEDSKQCFGHHQFGRRPVDVAKSADRQTVLARLSWGYHDSIGCYLVLDDAALAALRAHAATDATPVATPVAIPQDEYTPCRPMGKTGFPLPSEALPSTGTLRVAVLFVDFDEAAADYSTEDEAEQGLPFAEEYLESNSYGRIDIEFVPHHKWLRAEHSRDFYNIDGSSRFGPDGWEKVGVTIQSEAVRLAAPEFDFAGFGSILVVMPSKHFGGGNSGAGGNQTDAGDFYWAPVINSMNVIGGPEGLKHWGYVAAHELAHALGLNDLYAHIVSRPDLPQGRRWTEAEFGLMGLDVNFPTDPSFFSHTYAIEMLAWSRWRLGWLQPEQVSCITEDDATVILNAVASPGSGTAMAAVPLSDTEVIVVESRRKVGYDGEGLGILPGEGLFVYTVDAALGSGELPIKIGEDTGNGHIERSPLLAAGESIDVRGYRFTVQSSSPEADAVVITKLDS